MKKSFLLLEIFIWILLLGGLALAGMHTIRHYFGNNQNYQVIFKDVDNLMVGAPVRIMGIQIGHVTHIRPIKDKVEVSFTVKNRRFFIPNGSNISIQFTGIAGSKSLEIESPGSTSHQGEFIKIVEPVRINSLMEIQAKITRSIADTAESILNFIGQGKIISIQQNIKSASRLTKDSAYKAQNVTKTLEQMNESLDKGTQDINKFIVLQDGNIASINDSLAFSSSNKQFSAGLNSFSDYMQNTCEILENAIIHNSMGRFSSDVHNLNSRVNKFKSGKVNFAQKTNKSENDELYIFYQNLNILDRSINSDNLAKLHNNCSEFKKSTERLKNF